MTTLLEIESVVFCYNTDRPILDKVSLRVDAGETVGLVGPNGAGKSTLLRIAAGLIAPRSGVVRLEGQSVAAVPARERAKRVAIVPQMQPPPPGFTAMDLVLMGRAPHMGFLQAEGDSDHAAAVRAMVATDCSEFADRPVATLSGGEQQRVALARALAQEARLLLLDEPTAHLDLTFQSAVFKILRAAVAGPEPGPRGVLAVVHDLTLAAHYCDRLIVLHQGHIVADGTPEMVVTPSLVREVYGADAVVVQHPTTGKPAVLPGA